jgi:DNA-binding PadR family transcriptional regulator
MTNAELAILSLVAEAPRHGYEIERTIEARGMRDWTDVGFSSIYYILGKLEKKGWVSGRKGSAVGKGPPRKVYTVTAAGRREFKAGVLTALSTPQRDPFHFQLGLACIDRLSKQSALDALHQHVQALDERAGYVRSRRAEQGDLPANVKGMFELSLLIIETQKAWIQEFIKTWETDHG